MNRIKFRKHNNSNFKLYSLKKLLMASKVKLGDKGKLYEVKHAIYLSEKDRITWVYKRDKNMIIKQIICVSYDANINNEWVTIAYYDSCHGGLLHRHMRISLNDSSDIVNSYGVKMKGTQSELLSWSIKDLTSRFLEYRRYLTRKSHIDIY